MARGGPIPDPRSVHRNPLAEWTEVPDVPFDFEGDGRALHPDRDWHPDTVRWFDVLAAMPHAVLWRDSDWTQIHDLALLKDTFYRGNAKASDATEIRRREALLGVSLEDRQKLRLRYRAPDAAPAETAETVLIDESTGEILDDVVTPPTDIRSVRDRLRRAV